VMLAPLPAPVTFPFDSGSYLSRLGVSDSGLHDV
jgi:hypothetical protein